MALDDVLARLGEYGIRKVGAQAWMARCPAHDDRTPSLSLKVGEAGRVLANCHAGCEIANIAGALGLKVGDFFSEKRDEVAKETLPPEKWPLVAEYVYESRAGDPLYRVQRRQSADSGRKTFRQHRADGHGGWLSNMDGAELVLYRLPQIAETDDAVWVCFSEDTEVLTPTGWVAIPSLPTGSMVAQWQEDGEILFATPTARQRFWYDGEMVNIAAKWCDLLITPEHRQPTRFPGCRVNTMLASQVRRTLHLPTSGVFRGVGGPSEMEARLLTAWLADGVNEKRGHKVSWNLKKDRKKTRLRMLLAACRIPWTEHQPQSTPDWTGFRVARSEISSVLQWATDEKRWPWESLSWGIAARAAILDEIGMWDGDGSSAVARRFFTSESQSAEVISAMAAVSGWGSILRKQDRTDARPESSVEYVLNLKHRAWRQLGNDPVRLPYSGEVFCLTVPSGYLVVRRNGKVTVSGNCEGEKDADNLAALGLTATTNVGGAGKWLASYGEALRGREVVILPDNDEPGEKHAALVLRSLGGVAARVAVVKLPGLAPKGDVSDWLAAGGKRQDLERLGGAALDKHQAFRPSVDRIHGETSERLSMATDTLTFGVRYLDDAMGGIHRRDLILVGAQSGAGKTQLATIAALSNCRRGRRVHYFALEAEDREIERRIKYQILAREYYRNPNHGRRIRYLDWQEGRLEAELGQYSDLAETEMAESVARNLHTYYRVDSFTSEDFATQLAKIAEETDLVVLDHLHYVDHEEDENENKGYKRIVKQIRDSALRLSKPVIVVAHIRKMDRKFSPLVPGLEDFHGSSDIGKISTKAVTIAPDFKTHHEDPSLWSTYIHVAKCRRDSTLTRYVAKCNFNTRTESYQELYSLGRMIDNGREYRALSEKETPSWAIGQE